MAIYQDNSAIFEAAAEVFKEKGLKFTMDDVAKRMGISKKTIYENIDSKEELLYGIVDYAFAGIKKEEKELLERDMDIVEKIRKVLIALPDGYRNLDFKMINGLKGKYPAVYAKAVEKLESDWEPTFNLLQQGIEEGRIKNINIHVLKTMLAATMQQFIAGNELDNNGITLSDALEYMMDIVMDGITV